MAMRQIVLDTETTGLSPQDGHRIIEIGCVELRDRRLTRNRFHCYLQPDREIDAAAVKIHGITNAFLADKPRFAEVAEALLCFIQGAELIIHNASFDIGFLNHELRSWQADALKVEDQCEITDTLLMARRQHPGQRNSLDALCKRYGVDNSQRERHGALLDAEILADVYLAMTGGQVKLHLESESRETGGRPEDPAHGRIRAERLQLRVIPATDAELAAHHARLAAIQTTSAEGCLWPI